MEEITCCGGFTMQTSLASILEQLQKAGDCFLNMVIMYAHGSKY